MIFVFFVLFFILMCLMPSLALSSEFIPKSWKVYSSPGVPVYSQDVNFPVQGKFVASIKPELMELNADTKLTDVNKFSFGWMDYYYLAQTINAKKFRKKHMHISGYIKLDKRAVNQYLKGYKNWATARLKEKYIKADLEFDEDDFTVRSMLSRYDNIVKYNEIQFYVLLHTKGRVVTISSTNDFSVESSQWQRLNVEVGIPKNVETITLLIFVKGAGNIYIDDISTNTQGKMLKSKSSKKWQLRRYEDFNDVMEKWKKSAKKSYNFNNLSFEKYLLIK